MRTFLFSILLMLAFESRAQAPFVRYVSLNYRLTTAADAYYWLSDSLKTADSSDAHFSKDTQLLIVAYPCVGWAEASRMGKRYFIRTKYLALAETPPAGMQEAPIAPSNDTPLGNSVGGTDSYQSSDNHTIYTGPRGGRYYINGNGNKTYIRRK